MIRSLYHPAGKAVGEQGMVIAFEPIERNHLSLQHNLKLNALTNVCSFRKALGERSGKVELYVDEVTGGSSVSSLVQAYTKAIREEVVELVEGDRFREAENLPVPRVVKIGAEGYEYAVIQGLQKTLAQPTCELVCCEIHPQFLPTEVKPERVLDLLKSLGFSHVDLYPPKGVDTYHAVCYKPDVSGV